MSIINTQYVPKPDTVAAFGCDTKEQLLLWRPEICGVCCLKMIGDTKHRTLGVTLWQLTEDCVQQGAFRTDSSTGKIEGIFHQPLVKTARTLGLHGFVIPRLPLILLRFFLTIRVTPILSIDLQKLDPKYEAGHLVIITGYDKTSKSYVVHDPSSVLAVPGKFAHVSSKVLKRISNKRGLILF